MHERPPSERLQRQALAQIAESKRMVLAVRHALAQRQPATVLITSAAPHEGKSLLGASLASAAVSMGEERILVMDLNWYRPALHQFFGRDLLHTSDEIATRPLADVIDSGGEGEPDRLLAPTDHDQVAGSALNGPAVARRLITSARELYDTIFIDTASVFPTNRMMMDPVMLASMVDGVMMVIQSRSTARQQAKRAYKTIELSGANIIGAVLNHSESLGRA
ncbi:hypothetical protein CKO25_00550 [Thiocapsa imhoffii]|uniref:Tyrosine-protein kinase family protein n=1 Tax=Thiocapsa imhoffii TaxID=382777 RepID=A0A9X0WEI9_9GAMM|nr:CpsD/CapB family tyrosine-protein kinase [Thiocapsa imhoffii]MBK1643167.1 hypothetical protein [Thiocapsa imhoffii]